MSWRSRVCADPLDEREPVHPGHFDVDEKQGVPCRARLGQPLFTRGRQVDIEPGRLQDALLQHARGQRVVDHQNGQPRGRRLDGHGAGSLRRRHEAVGIEDQLRIAHRVKRRAGDNAGGGRELRKRTHDDVRGSQDPVDAEGRDAGPSLHDDRRRIRRRPRGRRRRRDGVPQRRQRDRLSVKEDRLALLRSHDLLPCHAQGAAHRVQGNRGGRP